MWSHRCAIWGVFLLIFGGSPAAVAEPPSASAEKCYKARLGPFEEWAKHHEWCDWLADKALVWVKDEGLHKRYALVPIDKDTWARCLIPDDMILDLAPPPSPPSGSGPDVTQGIVIAHGTPIPGRSGLRCRAGPKGCPDGCILDVQ
jgi:hypothetical protein